MNKKTSTESVNFRSSQRTPNQRRTTKVRPQRKSETEFTAPDRQRHKTASSKKKKAEPRKRTVDTNEARPKRSPKSRARSGKQSSGLSSNHESARVVSHPHASKEHRRTKTRPSLQSQSNLQAVPKKKRPRKKQLRTVSPTSQVEIQRQGAMSRSEMKAKQRPAKNKGPLYTFFSVIYHFIIVCYVLFLIVLSGLYVLFQQQTVFLNHQLVSAQDNGLAGANHGAIAAGDLLVVVKKAPNQLKLNEPIALRNPVSEQIIARRLVGFELVDKQKYLQVTGNNQAYSQEKVPATQVIGAVQFTLPKLATIFFFIQGNLWLAVIFCVIFLLWLLVLRAYLFT